MTWKSLVNELYPHDGDVEPEEQCIWLGWDGWVAVSSKDYPLPEKQSLPNSIKESRAS